jgi:alpha-beta hydrolase superfamily lysophospholipase
MSSTDLVAPARGFFYAHAARASARGRSPKYEGTFLRPDGTLGRSRVDHRGLALDFDGARIRSLTEHAPHGGLRQALIPDAWDGHRLVVLLAGAGAYAAAYPGIIAWLLAGHGDRSPVAVAWEDFPGYGYSTEGRRFGCVHHVDDLIEPQLDLLESIPRLIGSKPDITLLGFSLGGQIALHAARRAPEQIARVVALAPLIRLGGMFGSWWFRHVLRLAAAVPQVGDRYLHRDRLRGKGYRTEVSSWYDDDYLRRKREDAHMDDSALLGSLHVVVESGRSLLDLDPPLRPVRLLHSAADKTCSSRGSSELDRHWKAKGGDVLFEHLDQYPHQLLQLRAPECFDVFRRIDAHLASSVAP